MIICIIVGLIAGFVLGVLFGRRNVKKVEKAVAEAKEVIAKLKKEK